MNPFDTVAFVCPREEGNANARLLRGAYNAFDAAGKKLGVNAVELAERMSDGGLAQLVEALEAMLTFGESEEVAEQFALMQKYGGDLVAMIRGIRAEAGAAVAKVKSSAA